jgi:chaperone required for assembly of F1-ATPase
VLRLPHGLAEAIAEEWDRQGERLDPASMALTGLANVAHDVNAGEAEALRRDIASFAETDLLAYRAEEPGLAAEQKARWDPWLDWAERVLALRLEPVAGIMPARAPQALQQAQQLTAREDTAVLPALHKATGILGSFVLAFGLRRGAERADHLFETAHLDERWQARYWGTDQEAEARRQIQLRDLRAAERYLNLLEG